MNMQQEQAAEIRKTEKRIEKRFRKALTDYQLIDNGDHVLVALSGGKDSLLLLELMARRSRILVPRFKVSAIHVRMENIEYESDASILQEFCADLGVNLHIVTQCFQPVTSSIRKEKSPCFLCSWYRRKAIFDLAQQLGCNKIALGHHQDDIIHTALMNMIFEGRFSSMPIKLKLCKMPLSIIRPLALQEEADIIDYASYHHFPKQRKQCPYEHDTQREKMRILFEQMKSIHHEARYSIWHALEKEGKLIEDELISQSDFTGTDEKRH